MRRTTLLFCAVLVATATACSGGGSKSASSSVNSSSSSSGATTATTGQATAGAPLTVNTCQLLTDDEVTTFAASFSSEDGAVGPPTSQAISKALNGPGPDETKKRYCTWTFAQTINGPVPEGGPDVEVSVERIDADQLSTACTLFNTNGVVRDVAGVGDRAQATGPEGAVLVNDVCVQATYGGPVDDTVQNDAVVDATLTRLASTVGTG
jgi:hypothetical protein